MKSTYRLPAGKAVDGLAQNIQYHLRKDKNMQTQIFFKGNGGLMIQARSNGSGVKKLLGTKKAISISLEAKSSYVEMEIVQAKWVEILTSLAGMCLQGALPGFIAQCAHDYATY